MKLFKRTVSLVLSLAMTASMFVSTVSAAGKTFEDMGVTANDIVVLYTNDVHGGVSNNESMSGSASSLGYAGLAAVLADSEAITGANNTYLVDLGDSIQGSVVDTMSDGVDSLKIMKEIGYDICIPGNHEFDYGVKEFIDIANSTEWAALNYISCNFTDMEGNLLMPKGTELVTYNVGGKEVKVGFVGISTPESIAKGSPADYKDADGNWIYTFNGGETEGTPNTQKLYDTVQASVDALRTAGAEYVVALGHMGDQGGIDGWYSTDVIANTNGIDVFLDGHAHSTIPEQIVENKDGDDVVLSSTGTKLNSIGVLKMTVSDSGVEFNTDLVDTITDDQKASDAYKAMDEFVGDIEDQYAYLVEVLTSTDFGLWITDPENGNRMVRKKDTSMGDFVTDAYLWYSTYDEKFEPADLSFLNGGSIRANIAPGEVTYTNLLTVFPWYSHVTEIYVTGQQILDCLEMGCRLETSECGGFMVGGGITYDINLNKESKVVTDPAGMFVSVDGTYANGDYRVENVEIGGKPIDVTKTYTLVINDYYYQQDGDGMTMFKNCEAVVTTDDNVIDVDVLVAYIKEGLGGTIPEAKYGNPYGDGRIEIISQSTYFEIDEYIEMLEEIFGDTESEDLAELKETAKKIQEKLQEVLTNKDSKLEEKNTQYFIGDISPNMMLSNSDGDYTVKIDKEDLSEELQKALANGTFYASLTCGTDENGRPSEGPDDEATVYTLTDVEVVDDGLLINISSKGFGGEWMIAVNYLPEVGGVDTGDYTSIASMAMTTVVALGAMVALKKRED